MNKEFVPSRQELELKELGLNEKTYITANGEMEVGILYQQAFKFFREKSIARLVLNDKGDYVIGPLSLLPLIFLNKYEIHVISPSVSYLVNDAIGRNIPVYAEPLHRFTDSAVSYEEAQLACLKKLIEIFEPQRG